MKIKEFLPLRVYPFILELECVRAQYRNNKMMIYKFQFIQLQSTSVARIPLGQWKYVRDRGSLS